MRFQGTWIINLFMGAPKYVCVKGRLSVTVMPGGTSIESIDVCIPKFFCRSPFPYLAPTLLYGVIK